MIECNDTRTCFAKFRYPDGRVTCRLLTETYPNGECPFCKPDREVTNGIVYPNNEKKYRRV